MSEAIPRNPEYHAGGAMLGILIVVLALSTTVVSWSLWAPNVYFPGYVMAALATIYICARVVPVDSPRTTLLIIVFAVPLAAAAPPAVQMGRLSNGIAKLPVIEGSERTRLDYSILLADNPPRVHVTYICDERMDRVSQTIRTSPQIGSTELQTLPDSIVGEAVDDPLMDNFACALGRNRLRVYIGSEGTSTTAYTYVYELGTAYVRD